MGHKVNPIGIRLGITRDWSSKWYADSRSDLDVLGRDDFFPRNAALLQESIRLGRPFTQVEWDRQQLNFLQKHTYFTAAARALREAAKQQHIAQLEQRLRRADNL